MKHNRGAKPRHAREPDSQLAGDAEILPLNARHPGVAFIQREIEHDRKGERWLLLKTAIAIAFVAVLVVIRQLFFA